jgi:hypothetical protein
MLAQGGPGSTKEPARNPVCSNLRGPFARELPENLERSSLGARDYRGAAGGPAEEDLCGTRAEVSSFWARARRMRGLLPPLWSVIAPGLTPKSLVVRYSSFVAYVGIALAYELLFLPCAGGASIRNQQNGCDFGLGHATGLVKTRVSR